MLLRKTNATYSVSLYCKIFNINIKKILTFINRLSFSCFKNLGKSLHTDSDLLEIEIFVKAT